MLPSQTNQWGRLSPATMRSDALHRALLSKRPATVEAIPRLPDLWSWSTTMIQEACADLVSDGRIAEDAHGRLIIRRRALPQLAMRMPGA